MLGEPFRRPLIFVAHPDDETLACGGLLQRFPGALVVFATDGTPAGYGLEGGAAQVMEWQLSETEIECKKRMMAEYRTQQGTVSTFDPGIERIRPATTTSSSFSVPLCRDYLYQERPPRFYHTRRHRLAAKALLKKFAEFEEWRREQNAWRQEPHVQNRHVGHPR
jgi:hypothetical protein